jgi:hypothetical protein
VQNAPVLFNVVPANSSTNLTPAGHESTGDSWRARELGADSFGQNYTAAILAAAAVALRFAAPPHV